MTWSDNEYDLNSLECLAGFCVQGLNMMRKCGSRAAHQSLSLLSRCFLVIVKGSKHCCKHPLHRIVERIIETLAVACRAHQTYYGSANCSLGTVITCAGSFSRPLEYMAYWHSSVSASLESGSGKACQSFVVARNLTDASLKAAEQLVVRFMSNNVNFWGVTWAQWITFCLCLCQQE